ncbi:MAG: hypothetical protein AABZ74_10465 [Cyanobacteriota bacterium]
MTKKVLIALPDKDFELTEASLPWQNFIDAKFEVVFSIERN